MNGLNQMDYGARRRFGWAPIWTGHDPLSEDYFDSSPFAYCLGNPVKFIDPFGMDVWSTSDPDVIDRFMRQAQHGGGSCVVGGEGWSHVSDKQFGNKENEQNGTLSYSTTIGGFSYQYVTGNLKDGVTVHSKLFPDMKGTSDPYSHYGLDGTYNLYTKNENDAAMQFYISIAGGELGGATLGAISSRLLMNVASDSRVFWSSGGNRKVMGEAAKYAAEKGLKTLEMTRLGKILTRVTKITSDKITAPLWRAASQSFANGATGDIHFFTGVNGSLPKSVWNTVERPILENMNIIPHIVGE